MRRLVPLPIVVALAALLFAACGGSKNAASPSATGSARAGSTAGAGVSDEAYLKVICGGTDEFYNAVQTATTADAISKVIRNFITQLKSVNPPSDLRQFNSQFIKYLQDAVDNPTSLLTADPPLPPEKARNRLVSKESDVEECKNPTFLDAANTPGPAASPSASPTS